MGYALDAAKYAGVREDLRAMLFGFAQRCDRREISHNGLTWEYLAVPARLGTAGGGGLPVAFFAGGAKLAIYSFAVIEALSQGHPVLAISQPDCGALAEHFEGVSEILRREGVGEFVAAGSSWGGCVAQAAMVHYRSRVQKAVLSSTGLAGGRAVSLMLKVYLASIGRSNPQKVVADFRNRALGLLRGDPATDGLWEALFADVYDRQMTHASYVSLIRTQIDFVDRYAPVISRDTWSQPVLILTTADETAGSTAWRAALVKAYPAADFRVLASGGHHPALLAGEEYARVIAEFLGS